MNLLSAAERLAAIDRSSVTFDGNRCVHAFDQFSSCENCLGLCPVGAIQAGEQVTLTAEKCAGCLACLPACPASAFSADDAVPALLNCAARLETGSIELVCKQHPDCHEGVSADQIAVQVRGCLAGLGTGAYISLAALGLTHVIIRTDRCAECIWSSLLPEIEAQLDLARQVCLALGEEIHLETVEADCGRYERPIWDADNPPLSRRDLFRFATHQGQVALARTMTKDQAAHGQRPGRDRQRIHAAIEHFPAGLQAGNAFRLESGFAHIGVNEECSACGVCGRACPTGALELEKDGNQFRLLFFGWKCTGCEACLHVCTPQALQIDHQPSFDQIFKTPQEIIHSGELSKCLHCNTWFADRPGQKYCPTCEFRRKNPYGAKMPPGLDLAKLHTLRKRQ